MCSVNYNNWSNSSCLCLLEFITLHFQALNKLKMDTSLCGATVTLNAKRNCKHLFFLNRIHFSKRICMFDTFTKKCTRNYTAAYTKTWTFFCLWELNDWHMSSVQRNLSVFSSMRATCVINWQISPFQRNFHVPKSLQIDCQNIERFCHSMRPNWSTYFVRSTELERFLIYESYMCD